MANGEWGDEMPSDQDCPGVLRFAADRL